MVTAEEYLVIENNIKMLHNENIRLDNNKGVK